jgi:hypothetical protein
MPIDYKYPIIALIIVIFLICIFYPPFNQCNYAQKRKHEHAEFTVPNLPTPDNIRETAETCAIKVAEETYNNIILPCGEVSDKSNIIKCFEDYNQYYEHILKQPFMDMYGTLRDLDYESHDFDFVVSDDTKEQYNFVIEMSNAYNKALEAAMAYINDNYGIKGYKQQIFIYVFQEFLTKFFSNAIVNIYDDVFPRKNIVKEETSDYIF